MPVTERPLRKDAERNRQLILDAAAELFALRGLCVTLNDIARHAGVGVGTVYRRFPDKADLIDELFEQRVSELVALATAALAEPDPWTGLTGFLADALELQARDRGFKEIVLGAPGAAERLSKVRARMLPVITELAQRARDAGRLRADVEPQDMPIVQLMVGTVIDCGRDVDPDVWRRYLALILRGMEADPGPIEPLPVGALATGQVQRLMASWEPPRR